MTKIQRPLVVGLGRVGRLLALFLSENGMEVTALDQKEPVHKLPGVTFVTGDVTNSKDLAEKMQHHDAIICCLPYNLTLSVAAAAHQAKIHYFDPTEDVETTERVRQLAKTASKVMIPQCGLAPGFIAIVGAHLVSLFDNDHLRFLKLRVGALPKHPSGQLGYAGNWSLEGLVHEYIADCDVIIDGHRKKVPPLRHSEILRIDGVEYEAFTTSGGLGTLTETYNGKIELLDYKSIRYPGHLASMRLLLEELRFREHPDELVKYLRHALPPDNEDSVLIHVSAQGDSDGHLQTKSFATKLEPLHYLKSVFPAILWTTAASMAAVVELVSEGHIPTHGFVKQEDIPLTAFLKTKHGQLYAKACADLENL